MRTTVQYKKFLPLAIFPYIFSAQCSCVIVVVVSVYVVPRAGDVMYLLCMNNVRS